VHPSEGEQRRCLTPHVNFFPAYAVSFPLPAACRSAFAHLHLVREPKQPHTRDNLLHKEDISPHTNILVVLYILNKSEPFHQSSQPTLLVQQHNPRTQRHQAAISKPGAVTGAFKLALTCIHDGHPGLFSHPPLQPSCPESDMDICSGSPPSVPPTPNHLVHPPVSPQTLNQFL
jgi:hypothetical protein